MSNQELEGGLVLASAPRVKKESCFNKILNTRNCLESCIMDLDLSRLFCILFSKKCSHHY